VELMARLAGMAGPEARATFNGGIGMAVVAAAEAAPAVLDALPDGIVIGEVATAAELGGRYVEGRLSEGLE
jgi:phosphoribosylaminoimidazole (AIR) synthetase